MANRVFIGHVLPANQQPSPDNVPSVYRLEEVPRERIVECTVTDAIGLEDDTCTLVLEQGTFAGDFLPRSASIIVVVADVPGSNQQFLFPPYDIDTLEYDGEDGAMVLTAKVNLYFFINFLRLAPGLVNHITGLSTVAPFSKWSTNPHWAATIVAQIVEDTSFAGIKSTLKSRGILMKQTAVPSIDAAGNFVVQRAVTVEPYYPDQEGSSRTWYTPTFNQAGDTIVSVSPTTTLLTRPLPPNDTKLVLPRFPSTFNRSGDFTRRRIMIGEQQPSIAAPGGISTVFIESGDLEPRIFLPIQQNAFDVYQSLDVKRWQLQQEAAETRVVVGLDPTLVPRSIVTIEQSRLAGNDIPVAPSIEAVNTNTHTNWWIKKATHHIFPDAWTTELELGWSQGTLSQAFPPLVLDEGVMRVVVDMAQVVERDSVLLYWARMNISQTGGQDLQPPVTGALLTMGEGTPGERVVEIEEIPDEVFPWVEIPATSPFNWYKLQPLSPAGVYAAPVIEEVSPQYLYPEITLGTVNQTRQSSGETGGNGERVDITLNLPNMAVHKFRGASADNPGREPDDTTDKYAIAVLTTVTKDLGAISYHRLIQRPIPLRLDVLIDFVVINARTRGLSWDIANRTIRRESRDPSPGEAGHPILQYFLGADDNATEERTIKVTVVLNNPTPPETIAGVYQFEHRAALIRIGGGDDFEIDYNNPAIYNLFLEQVSDIARTPVLAHEVIVTS